MHQHTHYGHPLTYASDVTRTLQITAAANNAVSSSCACPPSRVQGLLDMPYLLSNETAKDILTSRVSSRPTGHSKARRDGTRNNGRRRVSILSVPKGPRVPSHTWHRTWINGTDAPGKLYLITCIRRRLVSAWMEQALPLAGHVSHAQQPRTLRELIHLLLTAT